MDKNYGKNTFACVRFIYNKMLSDKIEYYKKIKQRLKNTSAEYKGHVTLCSITCCDFFINVGNFTFCEVNPTIMPSLIVLASLAYAFYS